MTMQDRFGRYLHYLRVSVTDRCNLRCRYCMPEDGVDFLPHEAILTFEEILRLIRIAASLGVDRIRLTGGEPLVRKEVTALAAAIKSIEGIGYLGLTTNGILLPPLAADLKKAGVDGINISIDTLDRERFAVLTGRDLLREALQGLDAALSAGFGKVKVNCVLSPDSGPADWIGVAELAKNLPLDVRFIEWMPMGGEDAASGRIGEFMTAMSDRFGRLEPLAVDARGGPAELYAINGFAGRIGVIAAMSHAFCASCNRLRLTSTGDLKLCLFYDTGIALKPLLRGGATDEDIRARMLDAVRYKPKAHQGHLLAAEENEHAPRLDAARGMYKTGG